jgi:hypothetical protein
MNFKDLIDELVLNGINSFTISVEPDSNTLGDGYFVKVVECLSILDDAGDTYLVHSDGSVTFMEEIDPDTGDYVGSELLSTTECLNILRDAGVQL